MVEMEPRWVIRPRSMERYALPTDLDTAMRIGDTARMRKQYARGESGSFAALLESAAPVAVVRVFAAHEPRRVADLLVYLWTTRGDAARRLLRVLLKEFATLPDVRHGLGALVCSPWTTVERVRAVLRRHAEAAAIRENEVTLLQQALDGRASERVVLAVLECTHPPWGDVVGRAVRRGYQDVVAALLRAGEPVDLWHHACTRWPDVYPKLFIRHMRDINAPVHLGAPPLVWAARADLALVKMCIDRGASVTRRDNEGATALHYAAQSGNAVCVPLLVARGCPVNARDDDGYTAFGVVCERAAHVWYGLKWDVIDATCAALLECGADAWAGARSPVARAWCLRQPWMPPKRPATLQRLAAFIVRTRCDASPLPPALRVAVLENRL